MKHGTRKEHRLWTAVTMIEQQTNSCLCAMTTGVKRAHVGQAGEQTLGRKENWISTPVCGYMLLSSSSISVVQSLQEEVITCVNWLLQLEETDELSDTSFKF